MKGSISETVRKTVDASPQIRRMLEADLLNCSSYAASIKQEIEQAVGHGIGSNSIVMALRRYAAELRERGVKVNELVERSIREARNMSIEGSL